MDGEKTRRCSIVPRLPWLAGAAACAPTVAFIHHSNWGGLMTAPCWLLMSVTLEGCCSQAPTQPGSSTPHVPPHAADMVLSAAGRKKLGQPFCVLTAKVFQWLKRGGPCGPLRHQPPSRCCRPPNVPLSLTAAGRCL